MDSLGRLTTVFARNCIARRIDKTVAGEFLCRHHRLKDASCRYRYGLFVKRSTGSSESSDFQEGTLVAVGSFSSARRMHDGSRSFEWVRYASLSGCRVVGGMGKLLDTFVEEVHPDDVMTYADERWSDGQSYIDLGFTLEDRKESETFSNLKFRKRYKNSYFRTD